MVWLWLAILALVCVWIVWPAGQRRLPVLLLVRNRADEIEGVLRLLAGRGRVVYVVVRDSGDESWQIVRRLAFEMSNVVARRGEIAETLEDTGLGCAVLLRLDDGRPLRSVLREAGF